MFHKAVFLDRDGTINVDVDHLRRREDFCLLPRSAAAIRLLNEHGFRVVVITNQSVIGRGWCDVAEVEAVHALMQEQLAAAGARIDAVYYCPHSPDEGCACRKPQTTFYRQDAAAHAIDFSRSWAVGDRWTDLEPGGVLGMRTALVLTGYGQEQLELADRQSFAPDLVGDDLYAVVESICKGLGSA